MSEELKPCPFCKEKASHGLTKGQRDMHGDLNQNYAVWCPSGHARITAADRDRAAGLWNTCADLAPTDAQIRAHPKVQALVEAATALMLDPTWGLDHKQYQELRRALAALEPKP